MNKNRGFAPVILIFVIVLITMALAQCDVRYANSAVRPSTTDTGRVR